MNIDEQELAHIKKLIEIDTPHEFGPSFVQRTCGIGYNNALRVLQRGMDEGHFVLVNSSVPFRFKVKAISNNKTTQNAN